jgi:hypothetical protein
MGLAVLLRAGLDFSELGWTVQPVYCDMLRTE